MKELIKRLNKKGNSFALETAIRMIAGSYILYMGVHFSQHTNLLVDLLDHQNYGLSELFVVHYVTMGHIAGGILLILGLVTRIAALIQLPILVGAIIANSLAGEPMDLALSIMIFGALILLSVFGSGKIAMDYNLKLEI
ncbi:MAG: DoxX family protein [Flavobacteriales bacterium]|nr:DoxX family protein [Flavobacteriales bacterium]